jgi:hypothetical protein
MLLLRSNAFGHFELRICFVFFRTHLMCLNSGEEYMETFMGKYFCSIGKVEKKTVFI